MLSRVIAKNVGDVFLRHSVVSSTNWIMLQFQASANNCINCIKQAAFRYLQLLLSWCQFQFSNIKLFRQWLDLPLLIITRLHSSFLGLSQYFHLQSIQTQVVNHMLWIFDHLWFIILVDPVCLSDDNVWKPWHRKFISAHLVHLQEIWVKFVHEGRWVKVKVTGEKGQQPSSILTMETSTNPDPCSVKIPSPITPHLKHSGELCGQSHGMTAIFVTWPKVTTGN